jgi:hypothetical protein
MCIKCRLPESHNCDSIETIKKDTLKKYTKDLMDSKIVQEIPKI